MDGEKIGKAILVVMLIVTYTLIAFSAIGGVIRAELM